MALAAALIVPPAIADDAVGSGVAAMQAVETARAALLRQLPGSLAQSSPIDAVSVEPHTWNNSGLGCGPPRAMTTPVITEGFVVVFALSDGTKRRVHVAGSKAIVCDRGGIPNVPRIALPARDVGSVSEKAREDLAQRLGVPPEDIQVVKLSRVQWADSAMDCAVPGEAIDPSPVSGYLLQLRYNDREFTYHADSERVRACPPIESR